MACQLAAASAGVSEEELAVALDAIDAPNATRAAIQRKLEHQAAQFDDEYLRLANTGDEESSHAALCHFSKARATSALAFLLHDEPSGLHEAIYEAIAAMDDAQPLILAVEAALRGTSA
jgi:hypothetical protein